MVGTEGYSITVSGRLNHRGQVLGFFLQRQLTLCPLQVATQVPSQVHAYPVECPAWVLGQSRAMSERPWPPNMSYP
jgi:hypothetical protein